MISFAAVVMLSFSTLYLGTYLAERVENHRCSACGKTFDESVRRHSGQ